MQIFCAFTPRSSSGSQTVIQRAFCHAAAYAALSQLLVLLTACSLNHLLSHSLTLCCSHAMPAFCYCFCGKACKCFDKSSTRSLSLSQQLHPLIAHSCLLSELLCSLVLTTACSLNCLTCSTVLLALSIALCSTASLPLPLSLPSSSLLLSKQTRGTAWAAAAAAAADNFALFRPFWGVARRQVATHAHSRRVSRQRR